MKKLIIVTFLILAATAARAQFISGGTSGGGSGTVTSVSVTPANGVSGSVASPTTTPAISLALGAITPTTVNGNTFTTGTYTLTGAASKVFTFSNTLTLAGTDGTTMTFPSTSANVVTDTATQTISNKTFVAPALGAATATSLNKVTITAPASSATLTIANGATLSVPSSATDSGTNSGDQTITLSGDASGSGTAGITVTLPSIVTASTQPKITYNAKGQVTAGAALSSGDIPNNAANTTGSAATITTPRAINGVNFDGSAPITVTAAAGTLTGTLATSAEPAHTGDATNAAGSLAMTVKQLHLTTAAITFASSPYTVLSADSVITCDASSGAVVINLPAASGSGRYITIKKIDSSSNACTPTRAGSDLIDGATSYGLTTQYAASNILDTSSGVWSRGHVNQLGGDASGVSTNATVAKVNGVAYAASPPTDTVPIITASNTATYKAVPDCTDTGGNHLNYTASTHAISCGTSGGGSAPFADDATGALVKGTADATKLFGINVAGMTTGGHAVANITGTTGNFIFGLVENSSSLTNFSAAWFLGSEQFGSGAHCANNNCTAVGNVASGTASDSTAIGHSSSAGAFSTAVGAGAAAGGGSGTAIGAATSAPGQGSLAIGCSAQAQSAHFGTIGGSTGSNCNITDLWIGGGLTENATPMVSLHSTYGSGTNSAGSDMAIAPGQGSGNAPAGNLRIQTTPPGASGSGYGAYVDRFVVKAAPISLTSGAASVVDDVQLATLKMTGGKIIWTITCTDGTDMQAVSGEIVFSAVNKGGVYTLDIETVSSATPSDAITPVIGWAKTLSAGTLTTAWTIVSGTNKVQVKVTSTTSLTATSFKLYAEIINNSEQALN
jgi:hypothetical protein